MQMETETSEKIEGLFLFCLSVFIIVSTPVATQGRCFSQYGVSGHWPFFRYLCLSLCIFLKICLSPRGNTKPLLFVM